MENSKLPTSVKMVFAYKEQHYISEQITSTQEASFSGFLTMASYLCQHFPDMSPPGFPQAAKIDDSQYTLQQRRQRKLYYEPWCDYFNEIIDQKEKKGRVQKLGHTLYLISNPNQQFYQKQKESISKIFKSLSSQQFEDLDKKLTQMGPKEKRTRVGIINFATSQLRDDRFSPKVNLLSLYGGIWFDHGDIWKRYDVLTGKYPTQEEIMETDIFILSGSALSANDNNENIQKTMQILGAGMQANKKLRLLGLCFGHQIIAKHFGGKVERKELYSGIQLIKFDKEGMKNYKFLSNLEKLNETGYLMFEFHNDYVCKIPTNFIGLGGSQSSQVECMIQKNSRCLTFQFHSEYTVGYIKDFELKIKKHFKQDLYNTDYTFKVDKLLSHGIERHIQSCRIIREIGREFIDLHKHKEQPREHL